MSFSKSNIRDKLEDDVLDLSLCQLTDVPVKEINTVQRGTTLDLSNNSLRNLPDNFCILTHLVKLDLSKNHLVELPEYFGNLKNLKHLDLYSNSLEKLPVSFAQLKSLKWLDLKNNPLVPALSQAAGPCITANDCHLCAKKVVALLESMTSQLLRERQRRLEEEKRSEEKRLQDEETEREKLRAEKRAAKDRRRDDVKKKETLLRLSQISESETEIRRRGKGKSNGNESIIRNSSLSSSSGSSSFGYLDWMKSPLTLLFLLSLLTFGVSILLLSTSNEKLGTTFSLVKDTQNGLRSLGVKISEWRQNMTSKLSEIGNEFLRRNEYLASLINIYFGPFFCYSQKTFISFYNGFQAKLYETTQALRPYFERLGRCILNGIELWSSKAPEYIELIFEKSSQIFQTLANSLQ